MNHKLVVNHKIKNKKNSSYLYYKSSIMFCSSFTISSDVVHYEFLLFQWIVLHLDPDPWISKDI